MYYIPYLSLFIYYFTVVYYTCSLFVAWISLLSFTISCWFKQRKLKIELLPKILIPAWIWVMVSYTSQKHSIMTKIEPLSYFTDLRGGFFQ